MKMPFLPDNKQFNEDSLTEFLIFETSEAETEKPTTYRKAINSLMSFLQGRGSSLLPNPETTVCEWTVHMCVNGTSLKTALPYLNAVAGMYKKAVSEGLAPETDIFAELRSQLKTNGEKLWQSWLTRESFENLRNLLRARQKKSDVCKLLLYSLTNGCMPVMGAANIRIDSVSKDDWELLDIDPARFIRNRKYLFSFNRSGITATKLSQSVNDSVTMFLRHMNISPGTGADDTLRSYWAYAALNIGIAPHVVLSFLNTAPSGLPVLALCRQEELSEDKRREIAGSVAEMFIANPPKWFVMHLRQRVRFKELEDVFADLKDVLPKPELFYPYEEIYRRIGKKITTLQKPVIPDIVFFKYPETDVYPMFQKIGDIAWGYKTDGKDGDKYATVPRAAFERFQEAIGQFTPDYQVAPIGEIPLKEGDTVVILEAGLENYKAQIQKIEKPDAQGRIIYRMSLLDTGFEWTVSKDSRLVKKI